MTQPWRAAFSPLIVLSVGMLLSVAFVPAARAQEAISIPHAWKAGDRVRYEVVRTSNQEHMKTQGRSELTIEINEVTESGYLISWKYGPWALTHSLKAPLGPKLQSLAVGNLGIPVLLRFLPAAQDLRVVNAKELRESLLESAEETAKGLNLNKKTVEAELGSMRTKYEDEALVTRTFGKHANVFFIIYCMSLPTSQPVEYDVRLPNPFFDVDLPGKARFSVKTFDEAGRRATIDWTQTLDSARVPQAMDELLKGIESASGKPLPVGFTIQDLGANISAEYDVDLVTGWHRSLTYSSRININALVQEETVTMKRLSDPVAFSASTFRPRRRSALQAGETGRRDAGSALWRGPQDRAGR